jgi:hypothetical protein
MHRQVRNQAGSSTGLTPGYRCRIPASIAAAAMPTPRGITLLGCFHAQYVTRPTLKAKMSHVSFR